MITEVKVFQIIENEWREEYNREWGLGIVVSVDQGDGYVWIAKIEKDEDGYFVAPNLVYRHKAKLKETDKKITNLAIEFKDVMSHKLQKTT